MNNVRRKLIVAGATGAALLGGAGIAGAATSGGVFGTPSGHTVNGKAEAALSADTAAKVQAVALKKVPGTVERVESNVDSSAPYEAHIKKADGTEVEVQVNSDFTVAAVNAMGHH
jgi:hypothetical protein